MNNIKDINGLRTKLKNHFEDSDYIACMKIAEQIVNSYKINDRSCQYGYDLYNLAYIQQKVSKTVLSRKTFERAIFVLTKTKYDEKNKEDLKRIAGIINAENSIGIYNNRHSSRIEHSIPPFRRALELCKKYFSSDKEKIGMILHNIGCVYFDLGKYEEAIKYHEEALKMCSKSSTNYIDGLNFLGYSNEQLGNYEEAISYFDKALSTIKKTLGVNSDEYVSNLYNLGNVYFKSEGKELFAVKVYDKVLKALNQRLEGKHPYMSEVLTKISECNLKTRDYNNALKIQKKSLSILAETVGKSHIYYATNLKRIGDIYYILEEYDKSIKYYKEENKIKSDILGLYNDEHVASLINLINSYIKAGHLEKQEELANNFYKYIDFDLSKGSYIRGLLVLAKIYIKYNMTTDLQNLYEQYKNVSSESFDKMVAMALREPENILDKEGQISEIIENETTAIEEFEETTDFIMDGIKDFFDILKSEINSMSTKDLEDLKDFKNFTGELKSIIEDANNLDDLEDLEDED